MYLLPTALLIAVYAGDHNLRMNRCLHDEGHLCLYGHFDGFILVEKLTAVLEDAGAQLVGVHTLPVGQQGNIVSGKVQALVPQKDQAGRKRDPVTLEYRGLVMINRQGPLTPDEQNLEREGYSVVRLRPGHE